MKLKLKAYIDLYESYHSKLKHLTKLKALKLIKKLTKFNPH
jgi:hypothetical protein